MKIKTRDFGEVEIEESTVITVPNGIIGFEDVKRYTLLSPLGDDISDVASGSGQKRAVLCGLRPVGYLPRL